MNFICAFILLTLQLDDDTHTELGALHVTSERVQEDAFWLLLAMLDMHQGYYTRGFEAVKQDTNDLSDVMECYLPELHTHLRLLDVDLLLFTPKW